MKQANLLFEGSHPNRMQLFNIFRQIIIPIFIAIVTFVLVGCSSSSGSGENQTGASSALIEGVFVDSPVEGLNYQTESTFGITNENGRFVCYSDEMITFMVGDVVLGQSMASETITPMNFLEESAQPYDVTHPMVTNMARFLQSLDADGNPDNGITITDEIRSEVTGRMIDFHQSIEDFENDPHVIACFDVFNGLNVPHNNMMWGLTSAEDAQQHMLSYMGKNMPGYMNDYNNLEGADGGYNNDQAMNGNTDRGMNAPMHDQMDVIDYNEGNVVDYPMDKPINEDIHEPMDDQVGPVNNDDTNISEKDTTESNPALIEGVFIDSPVEGLNYYTETHSGITDVNGRFICYEGEMITFMLGDMELGNCLAKDIITPIDFLNESEQSYGLAHPMVTNMCRFLQSLDADSNPDNGITISPEIREEMIGRMIDFHQNIEDFENDPYVLACFDVFNDLNMPYNNMPWCLTSVEDAQRHMTTYMGAHMPGYMNGYMNLEDTDGDGVIDYPTNEYMNENMPRYTYDYMGNGKRMCW